MCFNCRTVISFTIYCVQSSLRGYKRREWGRSEGLWGLNERWGVRGYLVLLGQRPAYYYAMDFPILGEGKGKHIECIQWYCTHNCTTDTSTKLALQHVYSAELNRVFSYNRMCNWELWSAFYAIYKVKPRWPKEIYTYFNIDPILWDCNKWECTICMRLYAARVSYFSIGNDKTVIISILYLYIFSVPKCRWRQTQHSNGIHFQLLILTHYPSSHHHRSITLHLLMGSRLILFI